MFWNSVSNDSQLRICYENALTAFGDLCILVSLIVNCINICMHIDYSYIDRSLGTSVYLISGLDT